MLYYSVLLLPQCLHTHCVTQTVLSPIFLISVPSIILTSNTADNNGDLFVYIYVVYWYCSINHHNHYCYNISDICY